jgi:hypothetical protein
VGDGLSAMRSLLIICLLFVARLSNGQVSNVFTDEVFEFQWMIGSSNNSYGLQQWSSWKDAHGHVLPLNITRKPHDAVLYRRWTIVWYGWRHFRVPLPAAAVALIGVFVLLLLGWLMTASFLWISNRRGKNEINPSVNPP